MASNYPTSIDSFTDPLSNSPLNSPSHAGQHQDINDAVEKLETKLGIGSSPAASATNGQLLVKGATNTSWQPITSVSSGAAANRAVLAANGTGGAAWNAAVGLWLITNCTVTSVGGTAATASNGVITIGTGNTSLTISNAFSNDFAAYLIKIVGGTASAGTNLSMQLGASNTGYYTGGAVWNYNGGAVTVVNENNATAWTRAGTGLSNALHMDLRLDNPFSTARTLYKAEYIGADPTSASGVLSGFHNVAASYSAFTLFPTTGGTTLTGGTIRVYGYANG